MGSPLHGFGELSGLTDFEQPLRDDQFVLNQPPGSQLINVDQKNGNSTAENSQPSAENPKPMH